MGVYETNFDVNESKPNMNDARVFGTLSPRIDAAKTFIRQGETNVFKVARKTFLGVPHVREILAEVEREGEDYEVRTDRRSIVAILASFNEGLTSLEIQQRHGISIQLVKHLRREFNDQINERYRGNYGE